MFDWLRKLLGPQGDEPTPPPSANWPQRPTIATGGTQEVVGESNYQRQLIDVGGRTASGAVTAQLVREPTNPYDEDAVRIDVAGAAVGYLPREDAPRFHRLLEALAREGKPATCRATVTGDSDRARRGEGFVGIVLDIHPDLKPADSPEPVPASGGRVAVVAEHAGQETQTTESVPATWVQWPTIATGEIQEVVGESRYQAQLVQIGGGKTEDGIRNSVVTAQLIREPENPYDKNAVRVEVGGSLVGHLPREDARKYHQLIEKLAREGKPATCRASLTGGWDRGGGDEGSVGIELSVHPQQKPSDPSGPFLPSDGRVAVVGEHKYQDRLKAFLGRKKTRSAMATLNEDREGAITVAIEEGVVGALSKTMSSRYQPLVAAARDAGFPTSVGASVERGPKNINVYLDLAGG